jgi:TonB family protein
VSKAKILCQKRTFLIAGLIYLGVAVHASAQSGELLKIGTGEGARHLRTPIKLVYPNAAKLLSIDGDVELELTVSQKGDVIAERVVSGTEPFCQSALDAFKKAKYGPFLRDGKPSVALVAVKVSFSTNQKIPPSDRAASNAFIYVHEECSDLKHRRAMNALEVCQRALALSQQLSPGTQLEARAAAYSDVVQLLLLAHRVSDSSVLGEDVMKLVEGTDPNTQAVVTARLTRAQSRATAGDFPGSAADCTAAEASLRVLVQREKERVFIRMFREELKYCLRFHSDVMKAQGNTQRARELISEAKHL